MKYRKKPVEIDAVQWKGNNFEEIKLFANNSDLIHQALDFDGKPYGVLYINTTRGKLIVLVGDYIIKNVKGTFSTCDQDVLETIYEKIEE